MKQYWPMAIIKRGKEWDIQHTYDAAMSYEKAMDAIKIWRDEYKFEIISFWIDVTDNGKKIERSTPYVYLDLVKELWADFGDVPMDPETECIEDFWGRFVPGDHREEIWHWFEKTFHVSVAKDLMLNEEINMENYLIEHDDYFVWAVDKNYKRITTLYAWDYYSQYSYIKARDAVMRELKKEMNL